MNRALFLTMLKGNQKSIVQFGAGTVLYMWIVIWIYPSLAKSNGINDILKGLPDNLLSAFSLEHGIQKLSDYLAAEFYGLLFLIIMSIYCVVTATQLISRLVDRGSMAYLLATPASRVKIAVTQAAILLFGQIVIVLFATVGGLVGTHWINSEATLDFTTFVKMNLIGFLLFFVVSAYSFLFSCLFDDEKRALSLSAGLTIIFFVFQLIGKMSSDVDWLLNFTVFSAFDPQKISSGNADLLGPIVGLSLAGVILYAGAILIFRKKDLPI